MTRLYLVCTSHDPEQFSDVIAPSRSWIRDIRATINPRERGHYLAMIDRMGLALVVERMTLYKRNVVEFFAAHPSCNYVVQDDDGYRYDAYRGLDSLLPMNPFSSRNKKSHQDFLDLSNTPPRRPVLPPYLTNYSQYGSPTGRLRYDGPLRTAYHPRHTYVHLPNASQEEKARALFVKVKSNQDMVLSGPIDVVDGYWLEDSNLVLLTNQRDETENGVYVFHKSTRRLERYYSTAHREFPTYYVMEGMRWKGTYWGLKSATFPYDRRDMPEDVNTFLSASDYAELLDLGDTNALELDSLMQRIGVARVQRMTVLHELYKNSQKKSKVYTLAELVEDDIAYYKERVIFAGHEGVMTDFMPPREDDGPYTLVIDGRLIQGASHTKITILPKEN